MRQILCIVSLIFFFSLLQAQPVQQSVSSKRLIIKYRDQPTLNNSSFSGKQVKRVPLYVSDYTNHPSQNIFIIELNEFDTVESVINYYQSLDNVEYVESDFTGYAASHAEKTQKPSDPLFSRQWSHNNEGDFALSLAKADADADLLEAWEITQGNREIVVAILDSGIKPDHPEFEGRLWTNTQEIPENNKDDDGNGYVDDVQGWNFANENNIITDNIGHGTHIAGIIGASGNNAIAYAGADWNCRLMVCKVLTDDFSGLYSWWAKAIYYAVDNGAKVINMSLGGIDSSNTLRNAVDYAHSKNVLIVASMQNGNTNQVNYPAGYANSFAVGSTDPDDTRSKRFLGIPSYGSNYGKHIDLVAPGNYIYGLSHLDDLDYNVIKSGTSQSAALVSGIVSLVWSVNLEKSVTEIESIILSSAEDQIGESAEDIKGWDIYYGYGRINAHDALLENYNKKVETEFQLYPNPATDEVFMSIPYNSQKISIHFFNNLGIEASIVKVNFVQENNVNIDTSNFSRGLYYVVIKNDIGNSKTMKLVLR